MTEPESGAEVSAARSAETSLFAATQDFDLQQTKTLIIFSWNDRKYSFGVLSMNYSDRKYTSTYSVLDSSFSVCETTRED